MTENSKQDSDSTERTDFQARLHELRLQAREKVKALQRKTAEEIANIQRATKDNIEKELESFRSTGNRVNAADDRLFTDFDDFNNFDNFDDFNDFNNFDND